MSSTSRTPDDRDQPAPGDTRRQKGSTDADRSLINRPTDANRTGADVQVPPGVQPDDLHDPGSQTPDSPPVDNRS